MKDFYKNGLLFVALTASMAAMAATPSMGNIDLSGSTAKPSAKWQLSSTQKSINLNGYKPSDRYQTYFSREGKKPVAGMTKVGPQRAEGDAEETPMTLVNVNIDIEGYKYANLGMRLTCMLFSTNDLSVFEYAGTDQEDWNFDSPLYASVPSGKGVVAMVELMQEIPDYKGDGNTYGALVYSYVKDIDAEGESVDVTVKLSDANVTYEFTPIDHEGNPFPLWFPDYEAEEVVEPDPMAYTFPAFDFFHSYSPGLWNFGNTGFVFMAPSLEEDCSFYGDATLMFGSSPIIETVSAEKSGPVTENLVLSNDPNNFKTYSADFLLTAKDKECPVRGTGYVDSKLMVDPEWGPYISEGLSNSGAEGVPFNTATVYYCMDMEIGGVLESATAPETRTLWNVEEFVGEMKVAGSYTKDKDGKDVIIAPNIYRSGDNGFTMISPVPEFNIDPASQDIYNFYNSLFASSTFEVAPEEDGNTLMYIGASFKPTGYFNEYVSLDNPWIYLESIKHNGRGITLENIQAYPFKDAEYEVQFMYENVCVEGTFPCEVEVTMGVNTRAEDFSTPCIANFQVRDEDGKIGTRIPTDKKGSILLAANDDSEKIASIEISVAPNGSEDFQPLTADVVADENLRGSYAVADLSGLAHDTFYNVRVVVKDEAGNYVDNTIYYAFNITDEESGVNSIQLGNNANAEYYNLQGFRVSQPEAGQIYIVRRGNQVCKELCK